jgi:adenylate cyclase
MAADKNAKRRFALVFPAIAVVILGVVLLILDPWFLAALRNAGFDVYQRWWPRESSPNTVRIIDIDEESIAQLGQWPWSRAVLADAVDRLAELGSRVVVFDMVFDQPDRASPAQLMKQWPGDPEVSRALGSLPDPDRLLAESISAVPTVTGFFLNERAPGPERPEAKASVNTLGDPLPFLWGFRGWTRTLALFESRAAGNGALNYVPAGRDGLLRKVPLLLRSGDHAYPTAAAEAVRLIRGAGPYLVRMSGDGSESGQEAGIESVRLGGGEPVLTDHEGQIWLHFSPASSERRVSIGRLLAGDVAAEEVAGTVAILGASAAGLRDIRQTPLGPMPGSEVMAQGIEQLLEGSYLKRPPWSRGAELMALFALSALLVALTLRLPALPSAVLALAAVGFVFLLSWLLFERSKLLLDALLPALTAVAAFVVTSVGRHRTTEQERRWIRDAFSSYISPNLVEHLIEHPEELRLGGERRECTFVLTDLVDFTSLVEHADPAEVLAVLSEYLDCIVSIALEHEGTIDRIIGDAVAVMFSAPVLQPDHAARGVACALAMDRAAAEFRERKRSEGIVIGATCIGVNTGWVTVGNVGGGSLIDYRALGDAINTASRLETVNRQLGTRVCVSSATASACEGFAGRPVGELMLKGKSLPTETFEPLTARRAASAAVSGYVSAFELLGRDDAAALRAFRDVVRDHPEDSLAAFHLARLERGETGRSVVFLSK